MNALLVEAIPAARRTGREPPEERAPVVVQHVVLAGDGAHVHAGTEDDLVRGVELLRLGQLADVAGVQQQRRRALSCGNEADRFL